MDNYIILVLFFGYYIALIEPLTRVNGRISDHPGFSKSRRVIYRILLWSLPVVGLVVIWKLSSFEWTSKLGENRSGVGEGMDSGGGDG